MNFINIAGHLGADPEVRFTSSGKKVTTLRVAAKTRRGQNDDTIWWRVTVWGEQFDKMISYLKKGSPVIAFGELHKPEIFNDREGKSQASMEITAVHLGFSPFGRSEKTQGHESGESHHAPHHSGPAAPFGTPRESAPVNPYMGENKAGMTQGETFDDEVPF